MQVIRIYGVCLTIYEREGQIVKLSMGEGTWWFTRKAWLEAADKIWPIGYAVNEDAYLPAGNK